MNASLAGTRVLLIEDEAIIAMMAEDMLADLGCTLAAVPSTLAAALAAIVDADFDVALLDLNLDGEDSAPAAERLRSLGRPFVFTTGYGDAGRPEGFDDVPLVAKPYRSAEIAGAIGLVLGHSQTRSS